MKLVRYRKLEKTDICEFVEMRLNQLEEEGAEVSMDLRPSLEEYYEKHLADGTFVSWVAIGDNDEIVATSGVSFVEKPPYYSNPYGKIALISSMYTKKDYRRKRIGKILLDKVVQEAKEYGCGTVQITASDMGVFLYSDFGFKKNPNFMQLEI